MHEDLLFARCAHRLIALVNVGFAALTMDRDLERLWSEGRV